MKQTQLITITLNPSLDETITVNHLNLGYHNVTADTMRLDASGRGVNVSRALSLLDIPTHALVMLGRDAMGHAYKGLLTEQPFTSTIVRHDGHTRSDSIIFDQSENNETHIIDESSGVTDDNIADVIDKLGTIVNQDDIVILAGNLPRNLDATTDAQLVEAANKMGARVVLMTGYETLDTILPAKPYLIALTRLEMEAYFNYPVRTFADMVNGCQKLMEQGAETVLVINELFDGAVLITPEQELMAHIPTEKIGTDSGVADAMVAGYLTGVYQGKNKWEAFHLGAAAMMYAAKHLGNTFGNREQLSDLMEQIEVHEFDVSLDM